MRGRQAEMDERARPAGRDPGAGRRRPRPSAMALVAMMMVLLLLLTLLLVGLLANTTRNGTPRRTWVGGVAGVAQESVHLAGVRVNNTYALNAAEAGVWAVAQWLNEQPSPPDGTVAFRPSGPLGVQPFLVELPNRTTGAPDTRDTVTLAGIGWDKFTLGDGSSAFVRVYPYADNATRPQRAYVIEAVGRDSLGKSQVILRGVAAQDTFAKYAFFSNEIPTNYYVAGLTAFNGPVHFNGTPPSTNPDQKLNIVYSTSSTKNSDGTYANAIFRFDSVGSLTCAFGNDKINWLRDSATATTSSPPADDEEWKKVAVAGRTSIQLGMNKVDMPTVSTRQQDACLNGASAPSATNTSLWGVTTPGGKDGGIYINGNVDDMVLKADNATAGGDYSKQIIEVYQTVPNPAGGNRRLRTVVTINPVTKTTTIEKAYAPANSTVFTPAPSEDPPALNSTTNGVIYVAGHVGQQNSTIPLNNNNRGGVSGVIANGAKLNLVTDATKNVNIDNNLTLAYPYAYQVNGVTYARPGAGILGIVSNNVQVVTRDNYTSTGTPANLSIHATIMAYKSFYAILPDSRAKGTMTRLGGSIVSQAGRFGTFNMSDLSLQYGFAVKNNYDDRMINDPPPYFPSTGNLYVLVSLERVRGTLDGNFGN